MFSLDDGMRYWLFTEPTDMRKSFHMLSGIVNNQMSFDLRNGDVFIFINKNRNRIKLLRKEPGGLVIYAMMLDYGRFHLPAFEEGMTSHALVWRDLDRMIRRIDGVVVGPDDVDVADRGTREAVAVDGGGDALLYVFLDLFLFCASGKECGGGCEEGECVVMSHLSRGV